MTLLKSLTQKQFLVLHFISTFIREKGYSPSFEEIGEGMKLRSLATIHKHIQNIQNKGYLGHDYNRSRSITLTPEGQRRLNGIKASAIQPEQNIECPKCQHKFTVGAQSCNCSGSWHPLGSEGCTMEVGR